MNDERSFERFVADHVADSSGGIPMQDDFYDDMHDFATSSRQRPEWLAIIKEPPMRTNSRVAVGSPMVRVVAVMAATFMLALALAGAGIAGTRILAAGPIVVDPSGAGTVTTITAGIEMAGDGGTILVMPGTYPESLVIDKDVSISGDGPATDIIISGDGSEALLASIVDSAAELSNLTFSDSENPVTISSGAPVLTNLEFRNIGVALTLNGDEPGSPSLVLDGGTRAQLVDSSFEGGGGVLVRGSASPLIQNNSLLDGPHIAIEGGGDATIIRGNTITDSGSDSIILDAAGSYLVEGNFITRVALDGTSGVVIRGTGETSSTPPTLSNNTVENDRVGFEIEGASAIITGNTIGPNTATGVTLRESDAILDGNVIDVAFAGVHIGDIFQPNLPLEPSSPSIVNNEIRSGTVAVTVGGASSPLISDNVFCIGEESDAPALEPIDVREGTYPSIENNQIAPDCNP